ncbi:MAG: hypothetical protein V3T16_00210 [Gemmatimonadales bacterium]
MATTKKVTYCYLKVPSRAGQGAKVLAALNDAGVELLMYSGFPIGGGKAQLDFVPRSMTDFRRVARREGWRVSKNKKAFLIQGDDKPGVVCRLVDRLAQAGINATAGQAIAAGRKRFGMILWVNPKVYRRAARVLNAK